MMKARFCATYLVLKWTKRIEKTRCANNNVLHTSLKFN